MILFYSSVLLISCHVRCLNRVKIVQTHTNICRMFVERILIVFFDYISGSSICRDLDIPMQVTLSDIIKTSWIDFYVCTHIIIIHQNVELFLHLFVSCVLSTFLSTQNKMVHFSKKKRKKNEGIERSMWSKKKKFTLCVFYTLSWKFIRRSAYFR